MYTINNLRQLRKDRNIKPSVITEYLNISQSHYFAMERGARSIDPQYLEKLSNFYSVTIDYLLGKTTEAKLSPDVITKVEDIIKVDPDLFTEMCRAKDLPDEDRKKVREYAAMLIEKRLREKNKTSNE